VFTPSILTILGIILFLRSGYVVGNAGLAGTLVIIGIATAVSVLTSISLSAIATNIDVGGGGDYYLISRTLGLEFGGAIGIVLFVAQSVSVAFYAIGFGEVTASLLGWESVLAVQVVAAGAILFLFGFAWAGADVATRLQFVIMAVLVAALASFYVGAFGSFDAEVLSRSWSGSANSIGFWAAFAIFFPAVTGFTQGVSMSGDLADPSRSLPKGTFAAVGLSTVVYITVVVLLAGGVPLAGLVFDDGSAMRGLAVVGALVSLGVIAATLSSAMASFLGAPRILQSMASDRVYPLIGFFERGEGPQNNPRRAALFTLGIALATVLLGSVNVIAPVVSMFFLISYGLLNYATYYEAKASSPSFRPTFRYFNKWANLAGAILCGGAMLAISPIAGAASILVLFGIYQYLAKRAVPKRWADSGHSHHFQRAVESIRALDKEVEHARHWRPQLLVFSAESSRRTRLLTFAKWIEGHSGFTAAFRIVIGEGIRKRIETDEQERELQDEIDELGLSVHARAVLAPDFRQALPVIIQSFGIGRLRPNVVLFGWPESPDAAQLVGYTATVREVARLGVSVMSLSTDKARWESLSAIPHRERRIDVWWEDDDSGRLALMAGYLCTRNPEWRHASIRLIATGDGDVSDRRAAIEEILEAARFDADVVVLDRNASNDPATMSRDASLVLVPMHIRQGALVDPWGVEIVGRTNQLPITAAVHAGEPMRLDTDPSSGHAEQIADAEHAVDEATERLSRLEANLEEASATVGELRLDGATAEELNAAEDDLERVHRRILSARVRLNRAKAELQDLLEWRS
jgi:amino acid transporter